MKSAAEVINDTIDPEKRRAS
jgi:hypothetical protein